MLLAATGGHKASSRAERLEFSTTAPGNRTLARITHTVSLWRADLIRIGGAVMLSFSLFPRFFGFQGDKYRFCACSGKSTRLATKRCTRTKQHALYTCETVHKTEHRGFCPTFGQRPHIGAAAQDYGSSFYSPNIGSKTSQVALLNRSEGCPDVASLP